MKKMQKTNAFTTPLKIWLLNEREGQLKSRQFTRKNLTFENTVIEVVTEENENLTSDKFYIQDSFGFTDENIDEFEHNATTEAIEEKTEEKDPLDRLENIANRAEKTLGKELNLLLKSCELFRDIISGDTCHFCKKSTF